MVKYIKKIFSAPINFLAGNRFTKKVVSGIRKNFGNTAVLAAIPMLVAGGYKLAETGKEKYDEYNKPPPPPVVKEEKSAFEKISDTMEHVKNTNKKFFGYPPNPRDYKTKAEYLKALEEDINNSEGVFGVMQRAMRYASNPMNAVYEYGSELTGKDQETVKQMVNSYKDNPMNIVKDASAHVGIDYGNVNNAYNVAKDIYQNRNQSWGSQASNLWNHASQFLNK
jgi:hypothetical protein